jgi:hypothetical protein
MFISKNIRYESQIRAMIRVSLAVFIMTLVSIPGLMNNGNAVAKSTGSNITCGYDSICKSIEGNEFDLILYSSIGSEMVILYNKDKIGDLIHKIPESYYARAKGTVKDAIYYLSKNTYYNGFRFKKARKSTGLFRSKVITDVYVVLPKYAGTGEIDAPMYSFSEKNGKIRVRITPVVNMSGE